MLSNEFTKFKNIDSDFVRLMKQVNKEPKILEILKIGNLEKTLQNFTTQLEHIKKALNEYLEKQRQNFARFYFVGDEDLLEIIGNSKEIKNIQRHFPKMFAGITTVNSEKGLDDGDIIVGMNSREGESVPFNNKVNINEDPTIYKWLTKIEESMQTSLAFELSKAVTSLEILDRVE
jgi:dynein heavy chain 1